MKKRVTSQNNREKLRFREIGKGFIVAGGAENILPGRRLTKAYVDQFNRTYVQVNGELERVTEAHCFLAA